ncbi:MAG TPA: hypothetical protein VK432_09920 [Stellaceae bacterium]|nr:hypothetical protein [Stellaceae bacterium]
MSVLTAYLAKTFGVYCILVAVGALAGRRWVLPNIDGILRNGPLLFVVGIFTIGIGVAMVVGHNIWHGGMPTVVVTLIGWASLLKGLALTFLPQEAMRGFYGAIGYERIYPFVMGATLLLGIYLTAAGFGAV